jgi:hypothetical protein
MTEVTMAITESDAERQARIEADIRRLFARYRRVQNPAVAGSDQTVEAQDAPRRPGSGRFGAGSRPVTSASRKPPPRAL